jgi:hypothetical protein
MKAQQRFYAHSEYMSIHSICVRQERDSLLIGTEAV